MLTLYNHPERYLYKKYIFWRESKSWNITFQVDLFLNQPEFGIIVNWSIFAQLLPLASLINHCWCMLLCNRTHWTSKIYFKLSKTFNTSSFKKLLQTCTFSCILLTQRDNSDWTRLISFFISFNLSLPFTILSLCLSLSSSW